MLPEPLKKRLTPEVIGKNKDLLEAFREDCAIHKEVEDGKATMIRSRRTRKMLVNYLIKEGSSKKKTLVVGHGITSACVLTNDQDLRLGPACKKFCLIFKNTQVEPIYINQKTGVFYDRRTFN
jgi:hypothetical protein